MASGTPASPSHPPHATLERIIARKRIEVAKARSHTLIQTLQRRCEALPPPRNFFSAVVSDRGGRSPGRRGTRVIAEVKRRALPGGMQREDFDPVAIATGYAEAGAAALSVVTDEAHFGGHLGYIQQIKNAVPALPALRNDFIVDEYQIWESRAANADAVLLIAEVLPEGEMLDMMILARELGMTTLLQVHDMDNLLRVKRHIGFPHAGYSLLGISNRDPRTMEDDIGHTLRLLEMVDDKRVLVSQEGVKTRADLVKLRQHGVHIAMVGDALLRQDDPGAMLRELLAT